MKPFFILTILVLYAFCVAVAAEVVPYYVDAQFPDGHLFRLRLLYLVTCGVAAIYLAAFLRKQREKFLYFGFCCGVMGVFYAHPLTSRTAFLNDLATVRTGWSVADVSRRMSGYMSHTEEPLRDTKSNRYFLSYRHSDDAAYNGDIGHVYFENGKTVSVDFSHD